MEIRRDIYLNQLIQLLTFSLSMSANIADIELMHQTIRNERTYRLGHAEAQNQTNRHITCNSCGSCIDDYVLPICSKAGGYLVCRES